MDKHYLKDIEEYGVRIVPTHYIEKNNPLQLKDWLKKNKAEEGVVKPCIGGGSRLTYRFNHGNFKEIEEKILPYQNEEAFIVQPFIESIESWGEISIMMIGRKATHAIIKTAKKGDFRVQDDFGGIWKPYIPQEDELTLAYLAWDSLTPTPVYMRVDIMKLAGDLPAVNELELIEPEMWFRSYPKACDELAQRVIL
jgi:glutathione synthase/RimK-type ligase-like ATP-grasp enzyme